MQGGRANLARGNNLHREGVLVVVGGGVDIVAHELLCRLEATGHYCLQHHRHHHLGHTVLAKKLKLLPRQYKLDE